MLPNTALRPLLCRSPLHPDESLSSYLIRLALANSYEPYSLLTNLIHRRLSRIGIRDNPHAPKRPGTFDVLSELTWAGAHEIAAASIHRLAQAPVLAQRRQEQIRLSNGQRYPLLDRIAKSRKLRRDEQSQFCPDCLREAAYHHLSWIPLEVTVCLKHQCLLVDGCPCGHNWLSIHEIVRRRCSWCGLDPVNVSSEHIPGDSLELFAQEMIQSWWGMAMPPKARSAWSLPAEPLSTLYDLFAVLRESVSAVWAWEYFYELVSRPPVIHYTQTDAFSALVDWPRGFWSFLQAHLQRERALHQHNWLVHSDKESRTVERLWELAKEERFRFLREALSKFLADNGFRFHTIYGRTRIYWPGW